MESSADNPISGLSPADPAADLQSLAVGYRNTRGAVVLRHDLSAAPGDFIVHARWERTSAERGRHRRAPLSGRNPSREAARAGEGAIIAAGGSPLGLGAELSDSVWLLDGAGGFSVGTPDELSGSGAVGRAFDSDAIRFSPSQGRFEIRTSESA